MLVPVVLSGGSGTRLWPLSRRQHPKQLQPLVGERTMLQQTVARADGLPDVQAPIVVCNEAHADLVHAQLGAIERPAAAIVLEPVGRNTAPAVALAALVARARWPDDEPTLLCLPADHVVRDVEAFHEAVRQGWPLAQDGRLVTFGIVPEGPHTGYGYIRGATPGRAGPVQAFVEKPDLSTAEAYVRSGEYYWNSGMFLLRAGAYLEQLRALAPEILAACERAVTGGRTEGSRWHLDAQSFAAGPSDSIDYAVMEKTSRASVVPLAAGWSDVGSWDALHEVMVHDDAGNGLVGDVVAMDCEGSLLYARQRLVAAIGLRDLVVVETADAVLVAPRERSEEVKSLVAHLDAGGWPQAREHDERWTSWGRIRRLPAPSSSAAVWAYRIDAGRRAESSAPEGTRQSLVVVTGTGRLERPDESRALRGGDMVTLEAPYSIEAGADGLELVVVDHPEPR